MPSPSSSSSHTETRIFDGSDVTKRVPTQIKSKNNGLLIRSTTNPNYVHNNGLTSSGNKKYACDEDATVIMDDNVSIGGGSGGGGILLQPMMHSDQQMSTNQQQQEQAIVVNYTGGGSTRSSAVVVPQIVKFSHNSVQDRKQCYCKVKDIRSRIIVLILAVLVLGTAIGALTMYFSGNLQCGKKYGEFKI